MSTESAEPAGTSRPTSVIVGRIGKAHGIRGDVALTVSTDEPDVRFAPGAVLNATASRPECRVPATLTVAGTRWHSGRLLARFEELPDRTAVELARGAVLEVPIDPNQRPEDPEEFYDHQLRGLEARTLSGEVIGAVTDVVHGPAQDLLVIRRGETDVLIPFVTELVPTVNLDEGWLEVADRPGLLQQD